MVGANEAVLGKIASQRDVDRGLTAFSPPQASL